MRPSKSVTGSGSDFDSDPDSECALGGRVVQEHSAMPIWEFDEGRQQWLIVRMSPCSESCP
jgi:hypothetical protein